MSKAVLAARVAIAAFAHATICWLEAPQVGLGERIDRALAEPKALPER